ncbi:MAG: hypothetical protein H7Z43_06925 [Clostridia bacterium]|nr:hypothetical protein [Deltaproteobacteria bacterium]
MFLEIPPMRCIAIRKAIKLDGHVSLLIEAKAIGLELKDWRLTVYTPMAPSSLDD